MSKYEAGEQSGEPEPPVASVLKSTFFGGGPVTAIVRPRMENTS